MTYRKFIIFTDGGCSGNPGPASIGAVITENGEVIKEISKAIGQGTNNIAEYTAVIYALQEAKALKAEDVLIKTDSELMAKQVNGQYAVKHANIKPLFEQVKQLWSAFKSVQMVHIPREQNARADKLAQNALKASQGGRPDANGVGEESPSSKG